MDRSIAFYLVSDTYTQDAIGQQVATRNRRLVYGRINSVSRAEWSAAGEKTVEMDVNGETQVFGIYRTYQTTSDDLELYLEWKVGESNDGENIVGP